MSSRPPSDGRPLARDSAVVASPAEGALRQSDGPRTAVVPVTFLAELRAALEPEFGPSTRHVFYCTGFDWALRDMVRLGQRLRDELGRGNLDLWQMDARFVLNSWWEPLLASGWGACTFTPLPRGLLLAEITGSAAVAANPQPRHPAVPSPATNVCDLYAGLFAGALSFFERAERHAVEVQCAVHGQSNCLFIAGASPEIDRVESWRQQSLSPQEIRQRVAGLSHAPA